MNRSNWIASLAAALLVLAISGCGGTPSTPTKAAAATSPGAITVVVTATRLQPPPTLPVATLTPLPTVALTATASISTPVATKPTATLLSGTPRPSATRRLATPTAAAVAPTAIPLKYAAPKPIEPIFGGDRKDERHYPGEDLVFKWTAVGGFGPDECYLINVTFNPGQGDEFLTGCGNQTQLGAPVQFTLNRPNRTSPNYSSLLPNAGQDLSVVWYVTAVKNLGLKSDNVHSNTVPLSPPSDKVQFLFKGS